MSEENEPIGYIELINLQLEDIVSGSTIENENENEGVAGIFLSRSVAVGTPNASADVGGEKTVLLVIICSREEDHYHYMGGDIGGGTISIGPVGVGEEVGVFIL